MAGLAADGGLYVPDSIPQFTPPDLLEMAKMSYTELALRVMQPFIGDAIPEEDLKALIENAYHGFRHEAIAPLVQLEHDEFLLELFHGPTLAFKDFALQFLGRVLEYFLQQNNEKITVIGATSGDTGSAAIEGCRGRANMNIFILHPKGRVSGVQRRQMTTVADDNVFNIAVEDSFDGCQNIVKTLFADEDFRRKQKLTAVNSINWARILAQVVYYFYAALALGAPSKRVKFCVPTGNFGDIYAGYIASRMGLPVEKLVIATNSNDILARCLENGVYSKGTVTPTVSPSMDIQVSSNFERVLFDVYERDGGAIARLMQEFREKGKFELLSTPLARLRSLFSAGSASEKETLATIAAVHAKDGMLIDPHTAVGVTVARKLHAGSDVPTVILATAHPAKFPDVVKKATSVYPQLPEHLSGIMNAQEKFSVMKSDVSLIKQFIEKQSYEARTANFA
jgi:threonine synthase